MNIIISSSIPQFNLSYNQPGKPGVDDRSRLLEETGTFFQNLNGFKGRSLVPSKTQTTQASFFSQASTRYDTQTQLQTQFSLSQKHHDESQSKSQHMDMSQKSMMASMSQSIGVAVKKYKGGKIPANRYLNLRVDFANGVAADELPSALLLKNTNSSSLMSSPVPRPSGATKSANDGFIVTPLGRVGGGAGLCVDMVAETKIDREHLSDDEKSVHFSQYSRSSMNSKPFTQPPTEDDSLGDEDDSDEAKHFPLTQPDGKTDNKSHSNTQIEEKENMKVKEIKVGSKAFAIPYGSKGGEQRYHLCEVRDHRKTTSCLDGAEREEYKCAFFSKQLEALGKS